LIGQFHDASVDAWTYTSPMAKFRGTVRKSDLEGGIWQLECDDGETYVLEGTSPLTDGDHVEVEGSVDRNVMSFAMSGPTLKVKSVKKT